MLNEACAICIYLSVRGGNGNFIDTISMFWGQIWTRAHGNKFVIKRK